MKIRTGFVSNSSSSSFICNICGNDASGWDLGLEEAGMYECSNGHTFCEHHIENEEPEQSELLAALIHEKIACYEERLKIDPDKEYLISSIKQNKNRLNDLENNKIDEDEMEELLSEEYESRYSFPKSMCPVCSFKVLIDEDELIYLRKKIKLFNRNDLLAEIKDKFKTYDDFKKYLNSFPKDYLKEEENDG